MGGDSSRGARIIRWQPLKPQTRTEVLDKTQSPLIPNEGLEALGMHFHENEDSGKRMMDRTREQPKEQVQQILRSTTATSEVWMWGWLRLILGLLQISFSAAGATALLTIGFRPLTWVFTAGATATTITSLLLYHGQRYSLR